MEFWFGLVIGVHIGKIVVRQLTKLMVSEHIISEETEDLLEDIAAVQEELVEDLKP